jgi:aldehyde:ferredoxin oxidoreductase
MKVNWTGWTGKFIRVNLSAGKVQVEDDNLEWMKDYWGGRGIGIKYMMEEVDPKVDAFSPKNRLILATGPLTGTGAPSGNRCFSVTKSPLTDGIANASVGGYFGPELKYAGYDFIIIEGKAKHPVYLWIENDNIELRDARHIWGKGTQEAEDIIRSKTDQDAQIMSIGPAGENLVRFACVVNGGGTAGRAAGRGGTGAVMGSKNLKAVAVRGTKGVKVADSEAFKKATWESYLAYLEGSPLMAEDLRNYGTICVVESSNEVGALPTRNFQSGIFEGFSKIGGQAFAANFSARGKFGKACFGCHLGCARVGRVKYGGFDGIAEGPEYESAGSLGSMCGIDDQGEIVKAAYLCNELGLDTVSTGATIACAMELFEKGYLPEEDAGIKLNFGNAKALTYLVPRIASRDGFGRILAEGSYRMATRYGHPELSMSSKKQEYPNYDPRGCKGLGLAYATNNRGGDHIRGELNNDELFAMGMWNRISQGKYGTPEGTRVPPFTIEGKPIMAKGVQDFYAAIDSSGMCNFILIIIPTQLFVDLVVSATGVDIGGYEGLLKTGERIFNLERLFNLAAGMTYKDDTLPKRLLEEPMPEGPAKGNVVELSQMLPEYYKLRGWNDKGVPTAKKLKELGILVPAGKAK